MASIAVLPILIGLAVDYAIQFQSRAQEARRARAATASGASRRPARRARPTIATAALATATGFLVLLLSPVPMVRGFGLLLVVGIAVALVCALTAGSAALVAGATRGSGGAGSLASLRGARRASLRDAVRSRCRGGRDARVRRRTRLAAGRAGSGGPWSAERGAVARHPGRVLAVGAVLAVVGWVADTQTAVQSDVTKLVPSNMPALRDLRTRSSRSPASPARST